MNKIAVSFALSLAMLLSMASLAVAENYDPNTQALESLRLTLDRHSGMPEGKPTTAGIKERAGYLMMTKNALSLYRDGSLEKQDKALVAQFIKADLDYTSAALASSSDWSPQLKKLTRSMHSHDLFASQLINMQGSDPSFKGLMDAYHNGIGYEAYRAAQDIGIEPIWEEVE